MDFPKDTTNVEIPKGLCQCGCGEKTTVVCGVPRKFIHNHHCFGENNSSWNNGRTVSNGYVLIKQPDHPKANINGFVHEHIIMAEKALGKPLPPKAQVHHHGPKANQCLVICQDTAYHQLIEKRTRAYNACGNANWLKCVHCKKYDEPHKLVVHGRHIAHAECDRNYGRAFREKSKA